LQHAETIRAVLPTTDHVDAAASAAKALGDPTRFTIAAALKDGDELCVCDVAWVVGSPQNLVSHHLRQLKIAGLVSSRRSGRMVMYRLTGLGDRLTMALVDLTEPIRAESDRV
jgi:DNA-binding transcriptional ArsR family regulator